jgi:uncharacterized protein YkwD
MARRIAAFACVLVALAAPVSASAAVKVTDADRLERAVLERINSVRQSKGLRALASRPRLRKAATQHVRNMAFEGYFDHTWSDGTPYGRWIRRFWPGPGYNGWSAGENLYWEGPSTTAKRVVTAWMNSPGHRKNMLARSWRSMGVGAVRIQNGFGEYARVGTAFLFAVEFGSRSQ